MAPHNISTGLLNLNNTLNSIGLEFLFLHLSLISMSKGDIDTLRAHPWILSPPVL